MPTRNCGDLDLHVALKVKDVHGNESTEAEEVISVSPLVACSFVTEVDTGDDNTAELQYNTECSTSGVNHTWIFEFKEDDVTEVGPITLGPGTGAFTTASYSLPGTAADYVIISGTYESPIITIGQSDPGGTIEVCDVHSVTSGSVTLEEETRVTIVTLFSAADPCDDVAIADLDLCIDNFDMQDNNDGTVKISWIDRKNPPTCDPIQEELIQISTTSNGFTLTWEAASYNSSWYYEILSNVTNNWGGFGTGTVSVPTFTKDNFQPDTEYQVRIRANCPNNNTSDWTYVSITTDEERVTPTPTTPTAPAANGTIRVGANFVFDNNRTRLFELPILRFYLFSTDISRDQNDASTPAFDPMDGFGGASQDYPWGFRTLDELFEQCDSQLNPDGDPKIQNKMLVCTQGAADFIPRPGGVGNDRFPAADNTTDDLQDPNSYSQMADMMYHITARYGNGNVTAADTTVRPGTTKKLNLNLMEKIQPWNEYQEWWENGGQGDWAAEEFSAYMIACYNRIKEADPNMIVCWGGWVKWDADEWDKVVTFINNNQNLITYDNSQDGGNKFPADEMCIHIYQTQIQMSDTTYRNAVDHGDIPGGIMPEAGGTVYDDMYDLCNQFYTQIKTDYPQLNVSVTEYGYDRDYSPSQIQTVGTQTKYRTQADWNVRGYLAMNAAGIYDVYQYKLDDVNAGGGGYVFGSSGLCDGDTFTLDSGAIQQLNTPYLNFYWTTTYSNTLYNHVFVSKTDNDGGARIYLFEDNDNDIRTYVVWSPTDTDTEINGYTLQLQGGEYDAKSITMTDGSTTGTSANLAISATGTVTIDVNETPIFVQTKITSA